MILDSTKSTTGIGSSREPTIDPAQHRPACSARIQFREVLDVDELAYKSSRTPLAARTRANESLELRCISSPTLLDQPRSEEREAQLFVTGRAWSVTPGE